jgi:integrase
MSLKLVRRPKSKHWIIRGSIAGVRYEESTGIGVGSKQAAEEVRAKREAEINRERVYGRAATATFASAALSYLENGGSKRFMENVIKHFGTTPLGNIDQDAIDKGARKLYPDASGATRNRQFYTPVSAVMHHAARRKMCAPVYLERPDIKDDPVRWLTPEEAERHIAACAKHLRPLVIFLFYTGARCGEALWLDWRCVDLTRGHVSFPKTKNGEARGVPLAPRLISALANLKHRNGEVFRRPDGHPYERPERDDDTSAGTRISTAFEGACRRAKIEDFTPHGCRHTWATWHYAANRDLGTLMKLGGWKSERMVLRYAHTNVGEHLHTILRLPGGMLGDGQISEEKTA